MRTIVVDIETVGSHDPAVIESIAAGIKAPATYKKPESIAQWEAENKPAAVEEALSKTSFDGAWGHIICIGWKLDDQPAQSVSVTNEDFASDKVKAERTMLSHFWSEMHSTFENGDNLMKRPRIVGHNVNSFDLRFLKQRSLILGCRWPAWFPFDAKPWESDRVFDTMTEFAGVGNRISLDKLAKALGLSGKDGMTGADVWPAFREGKWAEIAEYCRHDVDVTYEVYKRLAFVGAA